MVDQLIVDKAKLERMEELARAAINEELHPDQCPTCEDGGSVVSDGKKHWCEWCDETLKPLKVKITITPEDR